MYCIFNLYVFCLSSRVVCTGRTGHPSNAPRHLWPNWPCRHQWSPRWRLFWTATPQISGIWSTWKIPFSRIPSLPPKITKALWSWRWESFYRKLTQRLSSAVLSLLFKTDSRLSQLQTTKRQMSGMNQQRSEICYRSTALAEDWDIFNFCNRVFFKRTQSHV